MSSLTLYDNTDDSFESYLKNGFETGFPSVSNSKIITHILYTLTFGRMLGMSNLHNTLMSYVNFPVKSIELTPHREQDTYISDVIMKQLIDMNRSWVTRIVPKNESVSFQISYNNCQITYIKIASGYGPMLTTVSAINSDGSKHIIVPWNKYGTYNPGGDHTNSLFYTSQVIPVNTNAVTLEVSVKRTDQKWMCFLAVFKVFGYKL